MKTTAEQPDNAKAYYQEKSPSELRRARITAIVLGFATIISLIFLVFAFIQKAEADKARATAESIRFHAEQQQRSSVNSARALQERIEVLEAELKACSTK